MEFFAYDARHELNLFKGIPMNFLKASIVCVVLLAACGQNSAKVDVSKTYLRPKISEVESDKLISLEPGILARDTYCTGKTSLVGEVVAGALASQIVKAASKKVKGALKEYSKTSSFSITSSLKSDFGGCVRILTDTTRENTDFITFQVKEYTTQTGLTYGIKVRPIWFNPQHHLPKNSGSGKDPTVAVVISVTPTYFVNNTRRTEATLQLVVVEVSRSTASKGGFFIPLQGSDDSETDWNKRPLIAAPPKGQQSTFKFEIATAVDSPKILTNLDNVLSKNRDKIEEELEAAILKLTGAH
jgi:hypothetical protein